MNSSQPLFEVSDLRTMHVGPLSFALEQGDSVVLSGPSGVGKSLMLRAMADLDEHKGGVLLQGREQSDQKVTDWRTQVAYLPAESAWWADTVGEHFKDAASIDWSVLGFEPSVQDWTVSRLSSGERQRLAMFRLLENKPRVLLLDEPTANLDAENTLLVEELVAEYVQRRQAAAVWVSHDQEQQKRLGARVIILGNHQEQNDD